MTEIAYGIINSESVQTTTSTSWQDVGTIASTAFEGSKEYLVIAFGQMGGSSNGVSDYNARLSVVFDDTLPGTYTNVRPLTAGNNYGNGVAAAIKITQAATPTALKFQIRNITGLTTTHVNRVQMVAFKVDPTDTDSDALHSGDYAYSDNTAQVDAVAATWVDCESITIGDGASDWLIIFSARQKTGAGASASLDLRLDVGGTQYDETKTVRQNGDENRTDMVIHYVSALASSTTVKGQFRSNTALGDLTDNQIMAIRLNAFEDFDGTRDTTGATISAADTDYTAATLTHTTSTAATRDWFFLGQVNTSWNEAGKNIDHWMDQNDVVFAGDHSGRYLEFRGSTNITNGVLFNTYSLADGVDTDITIGVQEESDVSPTSSINSGIIVGFTLELAAGGVEQGPIIVPTGPLR